MHKMEDLLSKGRWKVLLAVIGFVFHVFGVVIFWGYSDQRTSIFILLFLNILLLAVSALVKNKGKLSPSFALGSLICAALAIQISSLDPLETSYLAFNAIVSIALIQRSPYMPFLFGLTVAVYYMINEPNRTANLSQTIFAMYTGTSLALFILLSKRLYQERNRYYLASITDSLTQTYSFSHIIEVGQRVMDKGKEIELFLIDVNDFKEVNDKYGHLAGNEALIHIAGFLTKMTNDKGCVGRLGGDEFVIIAKEGTFTAGFAEKLQAGVEHYPFVSIYTKHTLTISISVGNVSSRSHRVKDINQLLHIADLDMYGRKDQKRRRKSHNRPEKKAKRASQ